MNHFRSHLETEEYKDITKSTTFTDVITALIACKNAQRSKRSKGKKSDYIDRLLQRIHHYKGVVDTAVQGTPELVSIVWASIKFLVQVRIF